MILKGLGYKYLSPLSLEVCEIRTFSHGKIFIHKIMTFTAADTSDFTVGDGLDALSAPGPRTLKCVTITAVDDRVPEGDEYITVSLSTSDSLVNIQRDSVNVTIMDNGTIIVNEVCSYMHVQ